MVVGIMRWMADEQTAQDMAENASHQFAVSVERKFTLISFFFVSLLFGLDEVDQAERAGSLAVAI